MYRREISGQREHSKLMACQGYKRDGRQTGLKYFNILQSPSTL